VSYLMSQIMLCAIMAYVLGVCVGLLVMRVASLIRSIRNSRAVDKV